jgi:hypothetical protein
VTIEAAIAITGFVLAIPGIIFGCLAADYPKKYGKIATGFLVVICSLWIISAWTAALA